MLKFALMSLVVPLALTARAADTTFDMSKVTPDQWGAVAQAELTNHGSLTVGIPGAVRHSIPQNQLNAPDCWSYALNGIIEALVNSTRVRGQQISVKLAPEYLEFWHLYAQVQSDIPIFQASLQKMNQEQAGNPNPQDASRTIQARIASIAATYQMNLYKHRHGGLLRTATVGGVPLDSDYIAPDEGSNASVAMREIERFGTVPFDIFAVRFRTQDQEAALENAVNALINGLLSDAVSGKTDLAMYVEDETGLNTNLINKMKAQLEPVYGRTVPLPTDGWRDNTTGTEDPNTGITDPSTEKVYSALTYMQMVHGLGLNFSNGYSDSSAGYSSHRTNMQAIAVGLMTSNLPTLLGFTLFQDNLAGGQGTAWDFAMNTGLFTSQVCPNGLCVNQAGGHEVEVVNFMGKMANGSPVPAGFTQAQMLSWVETNQFQVTALIVKNSWGSLNANGTVGRDANGQLAPNFLEGGYFIISDEYISNDFISPNTIPYDFTVPNSIRSLYPDLPYFKN